MAREITFTGPPPAIDVIQRGSADTRVIRTGGLDAEIVLKDGSITEEKYGTDSVSRRALHPRAVGAEEIEDGTVADQHIAEDGLNGATAITDRTLPITAVDDDFRAAIPSRGEIAAIGRAIDALNQLVTPDAGTGPLNDAQRVAVSELITAALGSYVRTITLNGTTFRPSNGSVDLGTIEGGTGGAVTVDQMNAAIATAIDAIVFPDTPGLNAAQVQALIDTAIAGLNIPGPTDAQVQAAVDAAISAGTLVLPVVSDARITAAVQAVIASLPTVSDAQIASAVATYLENNPPTVPGPTAAQIATAVDTYLTDNPPPGVTPTQITTAVNTYLQSNPVSVTYSSVLNHIRTAFSTRTVGGTSVSDMDGRVRSQHIVSVATSKITSFAVNVRNAVTDSHILASMRRTYRAPS